MHGSGDYVILLKVVGNVADVVIEDNDFECITVLYQLSKFQLNVPQDSIKSTFRSI